MISAVIASWLLAAGGVPPPGDVEGESILSIDPCVAVDEAVVRDLVALELREARARKMVLPASVTVGCAGELQEIRVKPWTAMAPEGVRTIQLAPIAEDAGAPARQARSRELALSIAELIRRFKVAHPPVPEPKEPPPPPPETVISRPPPPEPLEHPWQAGVLSRWEHFTGGQNLAGGDLFLGTRVGRFLAEVHLGGRLGADVSLPEGHLTTRVGTLGAAVGIGHHWGSLGIALALHLQSYLIRFRAEQPGGGSTQTALLGAYTLAAEPRLTVGLTRHLRLEASAVFGVPLHGVTVRMQGNETKSLSGLLAAGSLGVGVTF